jgi:hypothetical protein
MVVEDDADDVDEEDRRRRRRMTVLMTHGEASETAGTPGPISAQWSAVPLHGCRIYDAETGTLVHALQAPRHVSDDTQILTIIVYQTAEGAWRLVTAGSEQRITVWDPEAGELIFELPPDLSHDSPVISLQVYATEEGRLRLVSCDSVSFVGWCQPYMDTCRVWPYM